METAPSAVSVSPSSGGGLSQQFTFTGSSPSGYSNLLEIYGLFNYSVSGVNACYIRYNRASNLLYLADNSGANWSAGFVPGSGGSASNSYCSINGVGSSFSAAGAQLSVTVAVTFQTTFSGLKNEYLNVYDNEGLNSTWQQMGTWTVPATEQYTSIAGLKNCIQNTQYSTCALAASEDPYYVTSATGPILINRSNVTVTGGTSDRSQTKLVRDPAYTEPLIRVNASTPLTGVTIQNLTLCGSGTLFNPNPNPACPSPVQTACGGGVNCIDLFIESADTGTYPTNPFSYGGPYSVTIANVAMEDAAMHAIGLFPHEDFGQRVNDVYIHNSAINNSAITGILLGSNSTTAHYADRKTCDSNPTFRNDTGVSLPRNIRIENNIFANNNSGTIGGGVRWLAVRNNTFTNNNKNMQGVDGGTIFIDQCGDTVEISGNATFTGPAPSELPNTNGASGLELWGRNITVAGNTITGYPSEAIGVNSAYNVTITGNTVQDNDTRTDGAPLAGIQIQARSLGACDPIPRDVDTVTITGNNSNFQAYGVMFGQDDGRNTINGASVADNDLSGNSRAAISLRPMVTLNAYSGPAPTLETDPPTLTPRALAIDAVAPVTSRCSTPGSVRQTFKFAAAEVTGASNVQSIQGIFSIPGDDATGVGGPGPPTGAPYCQFLYDRLTGMVFLDDQNAGYTWSGGSSLVGPGGTSLSNGYCTIHAGSASSGVQVEPKVLTVTLDIEFLPSAYLSSRKHMYVVVINESDQVSTGGAWKYWGWWATP